MSDIKTHLNKIKTAIYGREVRSAIHDSIETIYKDSKKLDAELTDRMMVVEIYAEEAIDKANSAISKYNEAINSVVLWKGCAMPGSLLEFSIPEICFHHNKTTVTLMIESYVRRLSDYYDKGNMPIIVTMVVGSMSEMMGNTFGPSFEPYKNEFGYATNDVYANVHINESTKDMIMGKMEAKKTVDSRYAVGAFTLDELSDDDIVVTCISAIIPKEMEDES